MEMRQEQQGGVAQILTNLVERLRVILISSDFVFTELFNALTTLLWGAWIANPLWDTFPTTPTFNAMAELPIPETTQGAIIALAGLFQLIGLLTGIRKIRKTATFIVAMIWIFVSAMFIDANIQSTATIVYPMLAASAVWAYWRITVIRG